MNPLLTLTRPINFLDVEGTGTDTAIDRIVTLDIVQVHPDLTCVPFYWKFNPGVPMSEEVIAIHGITNEVAATFPKFTSVEADQILTVLGNHDAGGFSAQRYDLSILWEELFRVGREWNLDGVRVVDCCAIYHKKEPRNLSAAVKFYCGREHANAHNSMDDVKETINVLAGQLEKYPDLPRTVAELAEFCKDDQERLDLCGTIVRNKNGVAVFNTKRNKGVAVVNDEGYARWILRSDFPEQTKRVIRGILNEAYATASDDPRQGGLF